MLPLLLVVRLGLFNDDFVGFMYFAPRGWAGVLDEFLPHSSEFLRPLTFALFRLELTLFGAHVWLFHAAHLSLFVLAAALTGRIARRLAGRAAGAWAPALALLYPARIETVAWIAALFDLLALVLVTITLLLALSPEWNTKRWKLVLMGGLCFLAPLAKESAYALPLIIGAWELLGVLASASPRLRVERCAASLLGALGAAGFREFALGGVRGYPGTSLSAAVAKLPRLPEMLGRLVFLPINPSYAKVSLLVTFLAVAAGLLTLAIVVKAAWHAARRPLIAALVLVVAGLLPPLIYLDAPTMVWRHNRLVTLAGLGVALLASIVVSAGARAGRWAGAALLVAWTCGALLNLGSWSWAARCREAILNGIEVATRTPGTHIVWVAGPINEVRGAQILGGRLAEAVAMSMPGRRIEVDSECFQQLQRRRAGPPDPPPGVALHLFRFDPENAELRLLDRYP